MRKAILDYLNTQRVGVLALEMQDGSPHAATVHFAYSDGPFTFFFETSRNYRKSEPLFGKPTTRASLVIGFDENNMKTFQVDGEAQLLKQNEMENFEEIYYGKFPMKKGKRYGSEPVFFKFTPTWWRFTDWTHPAGKLIIYSENIDVLDEQGNKTGEVRTIDDVHWYGLWHSSARVWIINSKGEILLQHRDSSSVEFPDTWDVSAAGHVTSGSDSLHTAIEEAKEELGLDIVPSDLTLISRMVKKAVSVDGTYKDNSFEDIYLMKKDIEIDTLKMQRGEVQNLKWVTIQEFEKMVLEKDSQLVPHPDEYELLLNFISK